MEQSSVSNLLQQMAANWPSPIVARTEIEKFTGGLISEKYQANLDSAGKGPEGRIRIGRKVAYPVNEYLTWLKERSEEIPTRNK
jgi:hypothetical protein